MRIQVGDPNDPRLALGNALDLAAARLRETQRECGCLDGATCDACAPAAATHARLAVEYQALYEPVVLTAPMRTVFDLPIARWAWRGDAADMEH